MVNHMWESHAAEAPRKWRTVIVLSRGGREQSIAEAIDASSDPQITYVERPLFAKGEGGGWALMVWAWTAISTSAAVQSKMSHRGGPSCS